MDNGNAAITTGRTEGGSLLDAIRNLREEFSSMKGELYDAQRELVRLRREVQYWRANGRSSSELNLASLRRELAFTCHPDRGGDGSLMCRVNVLFDHLERNRRLYEELSEDGALS